MKHVHLWSLALLAAACPCDANEGLHAGFAAADITPALGKRPVYLAGYAHNRVATKIHDPIMARGVVLADGAKSKIALVSVDLVGLFLPVVERIRQRVPAFDYVLVSSTHNHEGPDTLGLWGPSFFLSGIDPAYLKLVEDRIVEVINEADRKRAPVRAKIGVQAAADILQDSRLPVVKHDELVALQFLDAAGTNAGLVVQWNCHPEALGSKNTEVSADYVDATCKHLQAKHRCPVVYLTGTVGGLMAPLLSAVKDADGKPFKGSLFERVNRYGQMVGEAADKAVAAARPVTLTPFVIRKRSIYLPLDNQFYLLGWKLGVLDRQAYRWKGDVFAAEPLKKGDDGKKCVATEIAWLRLGDLDVACIPGEIYPELVLGKVQDPPDPAADFKDTAPEPAIYSQLQGPHRMLIGLANDELGYIIPKRQWDEKKPFCYGRTRAQYGEINSLGPETAPLLCEAFRMLTNGKK